MEAKHPHYIARVNTALDYIELHLATPMTLEELAEVAHFSKFHFHRIFQSVVGESLFNYILRIRLEKAASLLQTQSNKSVSEIALQCGFSDLSIFSRNFKKHFNLAPSSYKKQIDQKSNQSQMHRNKRHMPTPTDSYFCSETKTLKWTGTMEVIKNISIQHIETTTLAYNRSLGPYQGNTALYQKHRNELFAWANTQNLIQRDDFNYLVLYHDNPNVALNDNQKMSLCVTVPSETEVEGIIGKMELQAGSYLVCQCELSPADFPKVWEWIYGQWFPNNPYVPADAPYFERYPEPPQGTAFKVDFCIPVQTVL